MNSIVTVASWEERFLTGLSHDIAEHEPQRVIMFYLQEYAEWTDNNRKAILELCASRNIQVIPQLIAGKDPAESWHSTKGTILQHVQRASSVLVNLSTMPREQIWTILRFLEVMNCEIHYTYYSPERYNSEWLSRDPQRPRLVYQISGIMRANVPSCLLILAGYDCERSRQLIRFYSPRAVLMGLQVAGHDKDNNDRMEANRRRFSRDPKVQFFDIDAYGKDCGKAAIERQVRPYMADYNVVMTSLGPKLSAVALYEFQRDRPEIGLSYAPSNEFNKEYSYGTNGVFAGSICSIQNPP